MKQDSQSSRGLITRLFGVILIVLGALNSMLAWRGGFAVSDAYVLLLAAGIFIYFIGAVRRGSKS